MSPIAIECKGGSGVDLGLVDLLNGLIAKVVVDLRERFGQSAGKIPVGALCNILHDMQQEDEFAHDLRDLDFRKIGGNSVSNALGDFLFLGGAWGAHTVPNPALSTISLDEERAQKRLQKLDARYNGHALEKLTQMADRFLTGLEKEGYIPSG